MKKVLFLMFLLFLIGLGTASLNAQVRIGGNAAPNASAVLDLNADDTNSGTKGLALPRVALTSNQMLLPGVTQNLTGMMVYNTSTTGTGVNRIGIYFWNGATWVMASLPTSSATDSGLILLNNGSQWVKSGLFVGVTTLPATYTLTGSLPSATLTYLGYFSWNATTPASNLIHIPVTGINYGDYCAPGDQNNLMTYTAGPNMLLAVNLQVSGTNTAINHVVKCWRLGS